jgi:hypothetical protein
LDNSNNSNEPLQASLVSSSFVVSNPQIIQVASDTDDASSKDQSESDITEDESCTTLSSSSASVCHREQTIRNSPSTTTTNTAPQGRQRRRLHNQTFLDANIYYSYSSTKGYLLLPPNNKLLQHLDIQYVVLDTTDGHCFGEPFLQRLLWNVVGPDTVMMNWLLASMPSGFVFNPRNRVVIELEHHASSISDGILGTTIGISDASSSSSSLSSLFHVGSLLVNKVTILLQTSFLFFITTTLVSFTLRETQEHMLEFTHQLSRLVSSRQPLQGLVTTHVLHNLVFVPIMVGMMFFLIEFYKGDKFLAFLVMTIVWICEVFSVIRYVRS